MSMANNISPLNPGQTMNIFQNGHLTQIQHKFDKVQIVDHFDKGVLPVQAHLVTTIDSSGNITTDIG